MSLFDSFGREIQPKNKPDDRVIAVAPLLDNEPGFQSPGLTPKRLAAFLKEGAVGDPSRLMELYEELEEKDAHLMSVLQKRRGNISGLNYSIEPASQDKKDIEIADFVTSVIEQLPDFEDNLKDITDGIGKGYSALELYWAFDGSRHIVKQMRRVEPDRFVWRKLDQPPRLLTEQDTMEGIEIPPFKLLFHVHKTKSGHPTRQGVLRVCSWLYLFKNFGIKDWVRFAEVYGMPLRLGKYSSGATKDDKEALIKALRSLGSDAAGIVSDKTMIEFIDAAKTGSTDLHKALTSFCNAEMSKAVLGQTLTTEQGDKGARSLGEVHENSQDDLKKDDCEQVSKSIRRDLIKPLVGFNFGWDAPLPWLHFEYEEEEDLLAEAKRYEVHMRSGIEIPANHYYEKFRIPKPENGEEIIRISSQPDAEPEEDEERAESRQRYRRGELVVNARQDEGDNLSGFLERLLHEAGQDSLINPVLDLLENSDSLESFRDGLLDLYPEMDPTDMGNVIQKGLEAAELVGRLEALPEERKEGA